MRARGRSSWHIDCSPRASPPVALPVSRSLTMSSPTGTGTKSALPSATASKSPRSRPPGDNSPAAPRFLVAGITMGHCDEYPFVRSGARPLKMTITDPVASARPFDLAVAVDRGVTTFPYPLPQQSPEEFLADPLAGWGEELNEQSSPASVEIAALPSATVTVTQGSEVLGMARWEEIEKKKVVELPRVRLELLDTGRNWVRTAVVDDETGQPVPCRVHFRSPDGIPYQPHGHHSRVNANMG